jgi:hypothetical protein
MTPAAQTINKQLDKATARAEASVNGSAASFIQKSQLLCAGGASEHLRHDVRNLPAGEPLPDSVAESNMPLWALPVIGVAIMGAVAMVAVCCRPPAARTPTSVPMASLLGSDGDGSVEEKRWTWCDCTVAPRTCDWAERAVTDSPSIVPSPCGGAHWWCWAAQARWDSSSAISSGACVRACVRACADWRLTFACCLAIARQERCHS